MSIYKNTSIVNNLCVGTNQVKRVYQNSNVVWAKHTLGTFGGLMVAPSPLRMYGSSTPQIYSTDEWFTIYRSSLGAVNQSMYLSWVELGQIFDSSGSSFSESNPSIDNRGTKAAFGGYADWRVPTTYELGKLFGTRNGSTVNGYTGCKYASVKISDISLDGYNMDGLLFVPDDQTITTSITTITNWNTYSVTTMTAAACYEYCDQGCVFFPSAGYYSSGSLNTDAGYYWTANAYNSNTAYYLYFNPGVSLPNVSSHYANKNTAALPVRLVRGSMIQTTPVKVVLTKSSSITAQVVSVVIKDITNTSHSWTGYFTGGPGTSSTQTGNIQLDASAFNISSSVVAGSASSIRIVSYNGGYSKSGYYSSGTWSGATLTTSNYIYPSDGTLWLDITIS